MILGFRVWLRKQFRFLFWVCCVSSHRLSLTFSPSISQVTHIYSIIFFPFWGFFLFNSQQLGYCTESIHLILVLIKVVKVLGFGGLFYFVVVKMWAASCLASCCAACACDACRTVVSGISRRSARIAYCGLFALSLFVSWILREVAAPLMEQLPCKFRSVLPLLFYFILVIFKCVL